METTFSNRRPKDNIHASTGNVKPYEPNFPPTAKAKGVRPII